MTGQLIDLATHLAAIETALARKTNRLFLDLRTPASLSRHGRGIREGAKKPGRLAIKLPLICVRQFSRAQAILAEFARGRHLQPITPTPCSLPGNSDGLAREPRHLCEGDGWVNWSDLATLLGNLPVTLLRS
jgi:hypothetical protein